MTQNRETTSQESPRFDPFEFYRQFYEANEQAWSKTLKDVTTTRDYAETQGKVLESMLAFQKIMRDSMNASMNNLNIPTRDDVGRLGEIMIAAEDKIDRLVDQIDSLEEMVARLEKRVEERMSGIEGRMPSLESRVADQSKRLTEKIDQLDKRLAGIVERIEARPVADGGQPGQGREVADTSAPRRPSRRATQPAPAEKSE